MAEQHQHSDRVADRKKIRAIVISRDVAQKHKYALAFWAFAGFALYMTLFAPPV